MTQSASLKIQIDPSDIVFLKFILEGYDHLSLPVVLDANLSLIKVLSYPTEVERLLELLVAEFSSVKFLRD